MATVTGLTADRMIAMENATVVDGNVVGNNLILVTRDGHQIDTGNVRGPVGPAGPTFIVCTSTTRPALGPAEEGKAIYETDTNFVRYWIGNRWRLQERIVCTSTTRPTGLVAADEGTKIYETDSNYEFTWSGSAWVPSNITPTFANVADRNAKWPTPPVGALSYLSDSPGLLWLYEAGSWRSFGEHVGTITPTLANVSSPDHVLCYGQTITGAQTSYPALWAVADAAWRSGSSIIVPDLRGRVIAGKDNMGGVAANRLGGAAGFHGINGTIMGSSGGGEWMHSHAHGVNDPGHGHWASGAAGPSGVYGGFYVGGEANAGVAGNYTGITIQYNGNGNAQNVQPTIILNWQLKIQ